MLTAQKLVHKNMSFDYYENEIRKFYTPDSSKSSQLALHGFDCLAAYGNVMECLTRLDDANEDHKQVLEYMKTHAGACFKQLVRLSHMLDSSIEQTIRSNPTYVKTYECTAFIHLHRLVLAIADENEIEIPEYTIGDETTLFDHTPFMQFAHDISQYLRTPNVQSFIRAISDRMLVIQTICTIFKFDLSEICSKHLYETV